MVYSYMMGPPATAETEPELVGPECHICKYRLLSDAWCSNCDMARFVTERDIEYQCVDCGAAIFKRTVGDSYVFETELGGVLCTQSTLSVHMPDEETLEWIARKQEDAYEPDAAAPGPDEYSVGHVGEWNHHHE